MTDRPTPRRRGRAAESSPTVDDDDADTTAPVLERGRDGRYRAPRPAPTPGELPEPPATTIEAEDLEAAHHWDARMWNRT